MSNSVWMLSSILNAAKGNIQVIITPSELDQKQLESFDYLRYSKIKTHFIKNATHESLDELEEILKDIDLKWTV